MMRIKSVNKREKMSPQKRGELGNLLKVWEEESEGKGEIRGRGGV